MNILWTLFWIKIGNHESFMHVVTIERECPIKMKDNPRTLHANILLLFPTRIGKFHKFSFFLGGISCCFQSNIRNAKTFPIEIYFGINAWELLGDDKTLKFYFLWNFVAELNRCNEQKWFFLLYLLGNVFIYFETCTDLNQYVNILGISWENGKCQFRYESACSRSFLIFSAELRRFCSNTFTESCRRTKSFVWQSNTVHT